MKRSFPSYKPHVVSVARKLRREATFPERLLWSRLCRRQLGVRMLRQHPIGGYVVDFYCPHARLAVELDGWSHEGRYQYDTERQTLLEQQGIRVIRFSNDEILNDLEGVVAQLYAGLEQNASPEGEGRATVRGGHTR